MNANDIFIVGYGGWTVMKCFPTGTVYYNDIIRNSNASSAFLAGGRMVQVTGASISRTLNVPTVNSYYLPYIEQDTARSPIRVGYGTYGFTGDLSFELTEKTAMDLFNTNFYERSSWFAMQFFDGQNTCTVYNCFWQNVSISCSPGGTVKISISFISNNGYQSNFQVIPYNINTELEYDDEDFLVPYWQCGYSYFQEFTFSFERQVTPVYLNNNLLVPSYLRPGLVSVNVNATTVRYVDDWPDSIIIKVGKKGIVLNGSILQSKQYSMSSMSDTGSKTYTWNSIALSPNQPVFSFVDY